MEGTVPQPKKTRAALSPAATALQEATDGLPAAARKLGQAWLESLKKLDTVEDSRGLAAVVIHNETQHDAALISLDLSKQFEKAVDAATKPSEAELTRRRIRKTAMDLAKKGKDLVAQATLRFRRQEEERLEREAREAAEAERQELLRQQEAAARKLEGRAKRTKDPVKKQALEEDAEAMRGVELQSVDAAVGEVMQEKKASWRGTGRGSERKTWSAELVSMRELILWVAEDVDERGRYLQNNVVELNKVAKDKESEDLGIPGVRGVSSTTLART